MIALGYIERPGENAEAAVAKTIRELRYNLGQSYQDAGRHIEAHEIFSELCQACPDEQRFAVRLFVSCQALGMREEMWRIVDDLEGRRRALLEEAKAKLESPLSEDERREPAHWHSWARYQPPVIDYLKALVLTAEKRYAEALAALERVTAAQSARPSLFLETADLYLRLNRAREARQVCEEALVIDPDNVDAHIGLCRVALRRRKFGAAAQSALDALQRNYHCPQAHFLLGIALAGMQEYERAAEAFRAAISLNPNFPDAHVRLAALLEKHLGSAESAREHRRLARRMRRGGRTRAARRPAPERVESAAAFFTQPDPRFTARPAEMPPIAESLIVVTGLPRSGTSMLMQMLAAGGMNILADGLREADEQNPRGYLEFEPVKNLLNDSKCLFEGRGRAVKIIAPLLAGLPPGLPCRVILIERDLDEILDSQERMLVNRTRPLAAAPQHRRLLKEEYSRILGRTKALLARRPHTQMLVLRYRDAISDSAGIAEQVNEFLSGGLDAARMAAAIDPGLHRNRAGASG